MEHRKLGVVHLVWMPFGLEMFRSFLRSYLDHPAGCEHELVILFNGIVREEESAPYHQFLKEAGIVYSSYYLPSGQDLDAYFWVAQRLDHEFVLFLNSYSRLLADGWGQFYLGAFSGPAVGAVAASASWKSYYSAVFINNSWRIDWDKPFSENFTRYKLLLKSFFYWRYLFKPFPNPHVRTNAFIIDRKLFLSLPYRRPLRRKFDAYVLESGRSGLSATLLKRGYQLLVVDKHGRTYRKEEWKQSATFWTDDQQNLLVSDNQTRLYEDARPEDQRKLTYLAWGEYE